MSDHMGLLEGLLTQENHYGRSVRVYKERPTHFHEVFARSCRLYPDKTALVYRDRRWTYRELDELSFACASNLRARHQVRKGDRVALLIGNEAEFVIGALAVHRMGAVLVPLNTRLLARELVYMLNNSGTAVLVTTPEQWQKLAPFIAELAALRAVYMAVGPAAPGTLPFADLLTPPVEPLPFVSIAEGDPIYLTYTSGTTGLPKGACCTHFNVIHSMINFQVVKRFRPEEITLLGVPIFHITGLVAQFAQMIYVGGTIVLQPQPFRAAVALELIERERVSHFFGVPTIFIMLMSSPDFQTRDIASLRLVASGGAPLPPDVVETWTTRQPGIAFINFYGLTETTSPATYLPDAYKLKKPGSAGLPLPVTELRVVGDDDRDLGVGEVGELLIKGPEVFLGYWNNPEANEKAIRDGGWFYTGDLARIDPDGFLWIMDRKKDMVNRGGEKIYCAEVENVIYGHPGVLEVAVLGKPDSFYGETVLAVVVPRPGVTLTAADITAWTRERLADYKVPATVEFRTDLPRNPGGKVMKQVLRQELQAG
ncbi:MAG: long-chain fatty acid--CoA ligase [Firmicutes bacterium]|nr:long-chain fatty acid--CoA ligase [Bacillota bacterium]